MFARDSHRSARVAFMKTGLLHQPGGRKLHLAVWCGIAGHGLVGNAFARHSLNARGFGRADKGVFEKRSGAAAVLVTLDDQQGLAPANGAYGIAHFLARGLRFSLRGKKISYIGIFDLWFAAAVQEIANFENDIPIALSSVKSAGAIAETTISVAHLHDVAAGNLKDADPRDGL